MTAIRHTSQPPARIVKDRDGDMWSAERMGRQILCRRAQPGRRESGFARRVWRDISGFPLDTRRRPLHRIRGIGMKMPTTFLARGFPINRVELCRPFALDGDMPTDFRLREQCDAARRTRRSLMAFEPPVPGPPSPAKDDVLASEAATYAFCAKAWHLEHALHRPPSAESVHRRSKGTALHDEHGAHVATAQSSGRRLVMWSVGLLILAAALVVLALLANR